MGRENGAYIDKLGKLRQKSLGEVGRIQKRMSKVSNINCLLCNDSYSLRATGRALFPTRAGDYRAPHCYCYCVVNYPTSTYVKDVYVHSFYFVSKPRDFLLCFL